MRIAIEVARALGLTDRVGVRLDSGDLDRLAREARELLDAAGLTTARIFASGGLDEHEVAELVRGGAPVDAFGIGTQLGVSADAPYLDTVYKLVEYDGQPTMKLSASKVDRARREAGLARTRRRSPRARGRGRIRADGNRSCTR